MELKWEKNNSIKDFFLNKVSKIHYYKFQNLHHSTCSKLYPALAYKVITSLWTVSYLFPFRMQLLTLWTSWVGAGMLLFLLFNLISLNDLDWYLENNEAYIFLPLPFYKTWEIHQPSSLFINPSPHYSLLNLHYSIQNNLIFIFFYFHSNITYIQAQEGSTPPYCYHTRTNNRKSCYCHIRTSSKKRKTSVSATQGPIVGSKDKSQPHGILDEEEMKWWSRLINPILGTISSWDLFEATLYMVCSLQIIWYIY